MDSKTVLGKLVDVVSRQIYNAEIKFTNGVITSVARIDQEQEKFIIPGLVDAHVHIESSMLVPTSFARAAVRNGTVATVSDPHEIANVMGLKGVEYMIENGRKSPFKFYFGATTRFVNNYGRIFLFFNLCCSFFFSKKFNAKIIQPIRL